MKSTVVEKLQQNYIIKLCYIITFSSVYKCRVFSDLLDQSNQMVEESKLRILRGTTGRKFLFQGLRSLEWLISLSKAFMHCFNFFYTYKQFTTCSNCWKWQLLNLNACITMVHEVIVHSQISLKASSFSLVPTGISYINDQRSESWWLCWSRDGNSLSKPVIRESFGQVTMDINIKVGRRPVMLSCYSDILWWTTRGKVSNNSGNPSNKWQVMM